MQKVIIDFIDGLKFRGARISLSETMDALKGVSVIGIEDRDAFRSSLRSTLIKDSKDLPLFDELFEAYFSSNLDFAASSILDPDKLEKLSALMDGAPSMFSKEFIGLLEGDPKTILELAIAAAHEANLDSLRLPIQSGYYLTQMMGKMGGWGLERELDEFIDLLRERGELENGLREGDLRSLFEARFDGMREVFRELIRREEQKRRSPKRETVIPERLSERSFSELSEKEIEEMREVIKELVKKIKDVMSLRDRRVRRGKFDIKKTLRSSQQYGGVPIKVHFKKRRKKKGQIITLCDVSRSVWNASRFMLNVLYSLQDQFERVRSFVFVSDVGEVTDSFKRYEVNQAIGRLIFEAGINFYSYTDYGEVLLRFYKDYLDIVNRRTTVIIIGDARNNFMADNAWALEKIKAKARKVIWLNPEPESWWGSGDSDMDKFLPHISEARECRNIKQLAKFAEDLII